MKFLLRKSVQKKGVWTCILREIAIPILLCLFIGCSLAIGTGCAGLGDENGRSAQQRSSFASPVSPLAQCAVPTYKCARTDTSVIPVGTLPAWGRLLGANTVFYDYNFNPAHPPRYVRVTDGNSSAPAIANGQTGVRYSGFSVGSGSGDDSHFNLDDSLFTITDAQNDVYIYGLNTDTMATGLVWYPTGGGIGGPAWSQVNRNYLYGVGNDGNVWRWNLSGCSLGGPPCSPPRPTLIYSFTSNCNLNPAIGFYANSGIGGGDTVFAGTYSRGDQDTGSQVVAYKASTNTCYFYNTRYGTVHSYTGTQTPITGTLTCNGTATVSGTGFGTGADSWVGLNVTINGQIYQVATVSSASLLTLGRPCPNGSWRYSIRPGTFLGTITSSDRYSVHDARIDPSGKWLIVEEGQYCFSDKCALVHAWQIGTATVANCVTSCGGHYTTTASGWFNADAIPNGNAPPPNYLIFRTWANFGTTNNADLSYLNTTSRSARLYPTFDVHPSAKNDPLGTHNYPILTSTYAPETPAGTITYWGSNEVVGWVQASPGPVLRFGHTFNSALASPDCCFTTEYAIGAASSTGKFYIFTTDGEGTLGSATGAAACSIAARSCRNDVFILDLAPPPAN